MTKKPTREILALQARIAQLEGKPLTRTQQRDLTWGERQTRARIIAEYCAAMPKGDYCELAGRQHKVIDDAARLYGLPVGGPIIDLAEALTALHDLIAANASRIRGESLNDSDRDELEDEKLRQQIQKLQIENDRLSISLQRDRGDAIPRAEVADALNAVAAKMREGGRAIERISPAARDAYNELLEALATEIETGRLAF